MIMIMIINWTLNTYKYNVHETKKGNKCFI